MAGHWTPAPDVLFLMVNLPEKQIVCTKTLYRYVDLGFFGIRNHNLPEKLKRKSKKHRLRISKKKLCRSIEERPGEIESREKIRGTGNATLY